MERERRKRKCGIKSLDKVEEKPCVFVRGAGG